MKIFAKPDIAIFSQAKIDGVPLIKDVVNSWQILMAYISIWHKHVNKCLNIKITLQGFKRNLLKDLKWHKYYFGLMVILCEFEYESNSKYMLYVIKLGI